jgi:NAD+ kinase
MVLSDTLLLRIAVPVSSRSSAYCSFDGTGRVELRQGDYVTVEASQYPFPTVVSGNGEWFESVRRALRWNVRATLQKDWDGNAEDLDSREEMEFDIDLDYPGPGTDSGVGPSEDGDVLGASVGSPIRRSMCLLNI